MPRTHRVGEQWDNCDRCGIETPMSQLRVDEDGFKICHRAGCWDPLPNEHHMKAVARALAAPTLESVDRRPDIYFGMRGDDEVGNNN